MCGISGIVRAGALAITPDDVLRVERSCIDLRHRGPDGNGQVSVRCADGEATLGHTRLSIIDLDTRGLQPMWSKDRQFCIVYNGEIFNYRELRARLEALGHRFRTATDTEVLLAAWIQWREDALRLLIGMFAFAVVDVERSTVTLARDAFGVKPLFFSVQQGRLAFASEIAALRRLLLNDVEANEQTAFDFLRFGYYDRDENTFFNDVRRLVAGHVATFDMASGVLSPPRRWWWPDITEKSPASLDDAADEFRERFLESVRLHLRSDVALGAALSGGLDSSSIVGAMRHLEPEMPIHTFSYVAPGAAVDETRWVDLVASHVGAISHKVAFEAGDLAVDLDDMLIAQGEPFGTTSIYAQYAVYRAFRDNGVTVSLDGQGADELLAGYHGYPGHRFRSLIDRGEYAKAFAFLAQWSRWPGRGARRATLEFGSVLAPQWLRPLGLRLVGASPSPSWIDPDAFDDLRTAWRGKGSVSDREPGRALMSALRSELSGGGLESLLRHGDRNSMRWSVESRVPFLTTDLAEFVLSLPEEHLAGPDGETKRVLRRAMRGIVPDEVVSRRDKIGFEVPEAGVVARVIRDNPGWQDGLAAFPFLRAERLIRSVDAMAHDPKQYSSLAWRTFCLGRWASVSGLSR